MISQLVNRPQDKPFKVLLVGETKPNETCLPRHSRAHIRLEMTIHQDRMISSGRICRTVPRPAPLFWSRTGKSRTKVGVLSAHLRETEQGDDRKH